jgi:energy-converting hydrogenase Eha subunit E
MTEKLVWIFTFFTSIAAITLSSIFLPSQDTLSQMLTFVGFSIIIVDILILLFIRVVKWHDEKFGDIFNGNKARSNSQG